MIIGSGIDIVEIKRFKANHQRLADKIFTQNEINIYNSLKDNSQKQRYIAKRFAAKEAVAKAFGCGFGDEIKFCDIEIRNDKLGKPVANVNHISLEKLGLIDEHNDNKSIKIHLSISDSECYAIANAIIEKV